MIKVQNIVKTIGLMATFAFVSSSVSATVIFSDNFNRANSSNIGNGWTEIEDDSYDINIWDWNDAQDGVVRLRDGTPDAELYRTVDTTGFSDIYLDFVWGGSDAWFISDTDTFNAGYNDGNGLVTLFSESLDGFDGYHSLSFGALSGANNNSDLEIRFWIDADGNGDKGYLDDVVVRGTAASVPEPGSLALLGLGLAGLGLSRRKTKA